MRIIGALVVLGVVASQPIAAAQLWRAKPVLEPGAPASCREADVSNVFLDFADGGNELSVKTSNGEVYSAPIAADGDVKATIEIPVGNRGFAVDLTGNVKTRQMEAFNTRYSCRFKLTPVP